MYGVHPSRGDEVADVCDVIEMLHQADGGFRPVAVKHWLRAVSELLGELRPRERVAGVAARDIDPPRGNRFATGERHLDEGIAADRNLCHRAVFGDSHTLHDGADVGAGNGGVVEGGEGYISICERGCDAV